MIVGIIRFSVLSSKGWQLSRAADPGAALFAPERLAARFALFECITLPFMKAEPGTFLILTSTLLPEPWRRRLRDGIAGSRNIHLREVAPDVSMARVARKFLARLHAKMPGGARVITYRLDDDDGLPLGRTQCLDKHRNCGAKIIAHRYGIYVGWNEGLQFAEVDYESNAQGIAFVSDNPKQHISLFGGHAKWTKRFDTLVLNEPASWLRTMYVASDSGFRHVSIKWRPLRGPKLDFFKSRFSYIDMNGLANALKEASAGAPMQAPQKTESASGVVRKRTWKGVLSVFKKGISRKRAA